MSTANPPSSRPHSQPLGRTFIIAICLLGAFAIIQCLMVAGHFIPALRQQLTAAALQHQQAAAAPVIQEARPVATAAATPDATTAAAAASGQKVKQITEEADRNVRIGEYDSALKLLQEAEKIVPGDPYVLQRKALVLERLDQPADAVVALESALRYPGLPAAQQAIMEKKLDQLSATLGTADPDSPSKSAASDSGAAMEENGVPVGSSLGIVDVRLSDLKEGAKAFQVAVKNREGTTITGKNVKILVYFYEENPTDKEVTLTDSKPISQWTTPPIDWANNEPELLKVQYTEPTDDTGKKYYGYVIGVYYNDELQDFRSEPAKLANDFPLPLFLKQGNP